MKAKYIFGIFVLVALLQAAAPLKMIYDSESTLRDGVKYKFKTHPIDPTDPFRGKYITLSFDIEDWATKDTTWVSNEKVYVYIESDKDGSAALEDVIVDDIPIRDYVLRERESKK